MMRIKLVEIIYVRGGNVFAYQLLRNKALKAPCAYKYLSFWTKILLFNLL